MPWMVPQEDTNGSSQTESQSPWESETPHCDCVPVCEHAPVVTALNYGDRDVGDNVLSLPDFGKKVQRYPSPDV